MPPLSRALRFRHLEPALLDPLAGRQISSLSAEHAPTPEIAPAARETLPPSADFPQYILVIDDEPDIRKMLQDVLEEEGYTTGKAVDGIDGLAQIQASTHPLVVLLDYKMPRMNGAELLQAVMAEPRLASRDAYILVTANQTSFSPQMVKLIRDARIPVIEKPFSFTVLLEEIERAFRRLETTTIDPPY